MSKNNLHLGCGSGGRFQCGYPPARNLPLASIIAAQARAKSLYQGFGALVAKRRDKSFLFCACQKPCSGYIGGVYERPLPTAGGANYFDAVSV